MKRLLLAVLLLSGCPDEGEPSPGAEDATSDAGGGDASPDVAAADAQDSGAGTDASDVTIPDAVKDGSEPGPDVKDTGSWDVASDVASDVAPPDDAQGDSGPLPPLETVTPFGAAPSDPLAGSGVQSCAVFEAERCHEGVSQVCDVYDLAAAAFVAEPDSLLRRVLLFERWYDLYHQPMGITADRAFVGATPAGTPEAEWGSLDHFAWHGGVGDGPIWTGKALTAYILRYLQTGTEADYARIEKKIRQMLVLFEVTGIPGYLARYPYLHGATPPPKRDDLILRTGTLDGGDHAFDPTGIEDLPPEFTTGVPIEGGVWEATPMWHGNPSIDQYSGFTTSFTLAWDLVKDEALKQRMAYQLTCYLKRLSRIEVRNLQQNKEALDAVAAFFAGGAVQLDPGDYDPLTMDTIVMYVMLQPNSYNEGTFEVGCPDHVMLEPKRIIDAAAPSFLLDLAALAKDMQTHKYDTPNQIDHFYIPNVRGGDAMQMMNLATIAYRMTGEEQYREFLWEELVGNIKTLEVAHIMGAFTAPKWCNSFFGAHITYTPLWTFISQLADGELKTHMQQVFIEEMWAKELVGRRNVEAQLMIAGTVPDAMAPNKAALLAEALESLHALGGSGGVLDDPRRSYSIDPQYAIDHLPEGTVVDCPTEAERQLCEQGITLFGITVEQKKITVECTGAPTDCPVEGGLCVRALASYGVPMDLRVHEDFMWQRNPYKLGSAHWMEGAEQSPGLDLIEPYWVARAYGFITEGKGQVLAWRDGGSCEP
ncbi:MAG: hypothetical protein AMXMBFR64_44150 [Myxococcales bacterium]